MENQMIVAFKLIQIQCRETNIIDVVRSFYVWMKNSRNKKWRRWSFEACGSI